jgi:hypothetical protein
MTSEVNTIAKLKSRSPAAKGQAPTKKQELAIAGMWEVALVPCGFTQG